VGDYVFVCYAYWICIFLPFFYCILGLFKQCAMLHFILLTYSIYLSYAIFLTDYKKIFENSQRSETVDCSPTSGSELFHARERCTLRHSCQAHQSWICGFVHAYKIIITLLPFFIEMLQYDWLWSGHMIIKQMFYIPIKLKPELTRASMTTSDVNNQWCSNFQQQII
jgi:hypothetical protein